MHILYSFKRCPYAMRARLALYLSKILVEHREVSLKNKPQSMIDISSKGTVPVLLLDNGTVIDESLEIVNWCIKNSKDIFQYKLNSDQKLFSDKKIQLFDNKFKFHLDRYKYASRYENADEVFHRDSCIQILKNLEKKINNTKWFFSDDVHKIDICILPFIRQFRIANPTWFDEQKCIPKTQKLLRNFLESDLLKEIMINYEVWESDHSLSVFPKGQ